jgi:hypothetical protein
VPRRGGVFAFVVVAAADLRVDLKKTKYPVGLCPPPLFQKGNLRLTTLNEVKGKRKKAKGKKNKTRTTLYEKNLHQNQFYR